MFILTIQCPCEIVDKQTLSWMWGEGRGLKVLFIYKGEGRGRETSIQKVNKEMNLYFKTKLGLELLKDIPNLGWVGGEGVGNC